MIKTNLKRQLKENYDSFISFIESLSKENYHLKPNEKWSAGEHLAHLVLSVRPLIAAMQLDKTEMQTKFGSAEQVMRSYEDMRALYFEKLTLGGKAPKRFDPAFHEQVNRTELCEQLTKDIENLCQCIENFSEEELDQMALPHPLLGKLSLREMLYNTIYHGQHHENLAAKSLNSN